MTTKPVNELQSGDMVTAMLPADDPADDMAPVTFDRPLEVTRTQAVAGRTVMVFLEGGRFWPCTQPRQRQAVLADA